MLINEYDNTMNPNNALFSNHDLDRIATEALHQKDVEARIADLLKVLENPEKIEEVRIGIVGSREDIIVKLNNYLSTQKKLSLCGYRSYPEKAKIELYEPYETAVSDEHFGTEFATSLISIDLYGAYEEDNVVVGKLVLFKLDHSESKITAKDLVVGANCVYGALITGDEIRPFRLSIATNNDRVIQELQRTDPTEEGGMSVDARLVEKSDFRNRLDLYELDIDTDALEYQEIIDELDKFIAFRHQSSKK